MANQPIQLPNIDLPGAEYFSLAPNRTIALQGRRRVSNDSPSTAIPAATDNINVVSFLQIESGFLPTSAIYIHRFWFQLAPTSGGLVVINTFCGLSLNASPFPDYPLGTPVLTEPTADIGVVVLTDRDLMATGRDIGFFNPPSTTNLILVTQLNVNNPTDAAINVVTVGRMIYTRLDGVVE